MKKIFTLLFSFGLLTTTFAQSGRQDRRMDNSNEVVLGPSERTGNRYEQMNVHLDDHPSFDSKGKERQLQSIRDEYNHKIQAVHRDRHLSYAEKTGRVKLMERERDREIRSVCQHENERNVAYHEHDQKEKNRY